MSDLNLYGVSFDDVKRYNSIRKSKVKSPVQKKNIIKALKEVEMIENGLLPKKSARDFLKELRQEG